MEAAGKIVMTSLLLNLVLFLPCFSAVVSSNPSFHPGMSKGPIHHDYTRFADVERHCHSVLSSAAEFRADADRSGFLMHRLSFMNGDWSQDAGHAPLLPFHGSYADAAVAGPELLEAVPLASFMVTHMDMAPRRGARTAVNVSGLLSFTITRNCCCSYMEPRASPEFVLRPGVARVHVSFQGVYTETKSSGSGDDGGGERVVCMVGDAVLPVRGSNSRDPWDWAKNHGGGSNFNLPVVADGTILLLLRYPMTATLTTRAVRGEMMSTRAKSDGAYFDTVRLVSQVAGGYDSGYQFQPEDAVAGCSDEHPLLHDGGDAMDPPNSGASLCSIIYQSAPDSQVMEVIPNLDCKGPDAFCSRIGPFRTSRPAMVDTAFTRSAIVVQGLQCKPTERTDGTPAARVAAVLRYVPPWEDQPTAAKRTGLSGLTLSAEGVWTASTGRVCMVGCLGAGREACHYRVTLSIRRTFSMTRRGNNVGQITAIDGSHAPLLFQQRVSPRQLRSGGSGESARMSYKYTKVEQAREILQRKEPSGFRDNFVARSLLSYPNVDGPADDMVGLSNLGADLNLRFQCAVKPPFVPEWIEEPFFGLEILSVGTLVGSYSPQFQGGSESDMRIELLGRVHGVNKQQMLNVSAEFTASRNFLSPSPVMSLEGVYNPEDGRMYLIGCRIVHAPWRVLSKRRDELEDGMDCSVEVTVEYPPTTTRWLISRAAKVSVASTRDVGDPLRFDRTELLTLPVMYREQRRDELTEPMVEGVLCITMLSATIAATAGQLRYLESRPDVAPYVSLAMLGVQAFGYSATLVADAKTLPAWPTRRRKPCYFDPGHLGWDMDCSVKALTLAALLLTARLAQKVWRSRARARARSPLEPARVPADGAVLLCSSGVHLGGLLFVLTVHWLSTPVARSPGAIYGEAQGMSSAHMRTRAAIVGRYAGVVKEWFLLPQVVGNGLWRVNCRPLAGRYYAGVTAVWLLPHVYGYLRPPVVNMYAEAHHDVMDFYSKASAVLFPVVGFVLALVVYVQQRWNYKIVGWAMKTEKNKLQHVY